MATGISYTSNAEVRRNKKVVEARFAGRIGGNQEFIADSDDSSLLKKQPDAAPLQSIKAAFDLESFSDRNLWNMAALEGIATMLLVFLLGGPNIGLAGVEGTVITKVLYGSLTNFLALAIFTYCVGPVSGGHLNPYITMGTFFAGLSTFPRTVLYIIAQTIGAIVAGFWLKLGAGSENYFSDGLIPGCTVDRSLISTGQMFALEFMFGFAVIFMAFGVGLDPRQAKIYGPAYAPVLVGVTVALVTLCSSFIRPGYTGSGLNPARCLGLMSARYDLQLNWVSWVASLASTALNGALYHFAPPWQKPDPVFARAAHQVSQLFHGKK